MYSKRPLCDILLELHLSLLANLLIAPEGASRKIFVRDSLRLLFTSVSLKHPDGL